MDSRCKGLAECLSEGKLFRWSGTNTESERNASAEDLLNYIVISRQLGGLISSRDYFPYCDEFTPFMLSHRLEHSVSPRNGYSDKLCVAVEIFLILTIGFAGHYKLHEVWCAVGLLLPARKSVVMIFTSSLTDAEEGSDDRFRLPVSAN